MFAVFAYWEISCPTVIADRLLSKLQRSRARKSNLPGSCTGSIDGDSSDGNDADADSEGEEIDDVSVPAPSAVAGGAVVRSASGASQLSKGRIAALSTASVAQGTLFDALSARRLPASSVRRLDVQGVGIPVISTHRNSSRALKNCISSVERRSSGVARGLRSPLASL